MKNKKKDFPINVLDLFEINDIEADENSSEIKIEYKILKKGFLFIEEKKKIDGSFDIENYITDFFEKALSNYINENNERTN